MKKITKRNLISGCVVLALVLFMLWGYYSDWTLKITGFGCVPPWCNETILYNEGEINLTVETAVEINFSVNFIDWGTGKVDTGQPFAVLDSEGTVVNGNWTAVEHGLILDNIGNIPVYLDLRVGKTAEEFIGGTNPSYMWKINDSKKDSCDANAGPDEGWLVYANTSTIDVNFCWPLYQNVENNSIEINLNLTIPYDSKVGELTDAVIATASAWE
jgi:hypothetical protein